MSSAVYIDSCVLIDVIGKDAGQREYLQPIIRECESGSLLIVTSRFSTVECTARPTLTEEQVSEAREFLRNEYILRHPLSEAITERAGDLARKHRLSPMDAVHLASCIDARCPILITRDGDNRLPRRKIKKLLAVTGQEMSGGAILSVLTPAEYHEMRLKADVPLWNQPPIE